MVQYFEIDAFTLTLYFVDADSSNLQLILLGIGEKKVREDFLDTLVLIVVLVETW